MAIKIINFILFTLVFVTAVSAGTITTSGLDNISCNPGSDPLGPSDDFIEFSLKPTGTGLGAGYTVKLGTVVIGSGLYDEETFFMLPPGSAGGGDVTIRIEDIDNPTTCFLEVSVEDPGSCACMITSSGISGIGCEDLNGTPTDPTDDFIVFDLEVMALFPGADEEYDVMGGGIDPDNGVYDEVESFELEEGSADGLALYSILISDSNYAVCNTTEDIPLVTSCSGECEIAALGFEGPDCEDLNNTPTDPTDDFTTFTLTPIGDNVPAEYNLVITNPTTGFTVTPTVGKFDEPTTFTISQGSASLTQMITYEIESYSSPLDTICSLPGMFNPPGSCSNACEITDLKIDNVMCNDPSTPTIPGDDYLTFTLDPEGDNLSGTYDLSVPLGLTVTPTIGTFGASPPTLFTLNAGSASIGSIALLVESILPECELEQTITNSVGTCSDECSVTTLSISNDICNDNGTPSDNSDDYLVFEMNPQGNNLSGDYTVSIPTAGVTVTPTTAALGTTSTFTLNVGSALITSIDVRVEFSNPDCDRTETITTTGEGCSDECAITIVNLSNITCNNNGTSSNPNDDYIEFSLNPAGFNLGSGYSFLSSNVIPSSGNYGMTEDFALNLGSAGGGSITLTIEDDSDLNCEFSFPITDPGSCSDVCNITSLGIDDVLCKDSGTPSDPSDDYISYELFVRGNNVGTSYSVLGGGSTPVSGNYNITSTFSTSDGTAGSGNVTITVTDIADMNCNRSEIIMDPGTCSDCVLLPTISGANSFCEGSSVTIAASGVPNATYVWSTGSTNPSIPVSTAGTYSVVVTDASGCTGSTSLQVSQINLPNLTSAIASSSQICTNEDVRIDFEGTPGAVVSYEIIGGTGGTSVTLNSVGEATILVTPSLATQITIEVNAVSAGSCNNFNPTVSDPIIISVVPRPFANISGQLEEVCQGEDGSFMIVGSPNATITYSLNVNASVTAQLNNNGQLVINVPNLQNSTSMRLQTVTSSGCPGVISNPLKQINVISLPSIPEVSEDGPHCFGDPGQFTISGETGTFVQYRLTNGMTTEREIPTSGSFAVEVTGQTQIQLNWVERRSSITCNRPLGLTSSITYFSSPAEPSTPIDRVICEGEAIEALRVTAVPGSSVNWYATPMGGSPLAVDRTLFTPPLGNTNAPGIYTYYAETAVMTAPNLVCTSQERLGVTLTILTAPPAPANANNSAICSGAPISTISVDAPAIGNSGATDVQVNWYDDSGNLIQEDAENLRPVVSNTTTSLVTYTFEAQAVFKYQNGVECQSPQNTPVTFTVYPLPIVTAMVSDSEICDNESTVISATATSGSGGNYSYAWNNNQLIGASHTVTPFQDARYTVEVIDGNNCINSNQVDVKVNKSPKSSFFQRSTVQGEPLTLGEAFEIISNPILGDAMISEYMWTFSEELKIFNNDSGMLDSVVTSIWNESNVQFPVFIDEMIDRVNVTLKVTDDNDCMDEISTSIQFENPDNCQLFPANTLANTKFCAGEEFPFVFEYVKSLGGFISLNNVQWVFPQGSGGSVVMMDNVNGLEGGPFSASFVFTNPGIWEIGANIVENPVGTGCNRMDDLVVRFEIVEPISVDLNQIIGVVDTVCASELVMNNLVFNYEPEEAEVKARFRFDAESIIEVPGAGGTFSINYGDLVSATDEMHSFSLVSVNYDDENVNDCSDSNEYSFDFDVINCGCDANFLNESTSPLDPSSVFEGLTTNQLIQKCLSEEAYMFPEDRTGFTSSDEWIYIVSNEFSQEEIFVPSIDSLNGDNYIISNGIDYSKVDSPYETCESFFVFPAVRRGACMMVSQTAQEFIFLDEPDPNLIMDETDFCLNDISARVNFEDANERCETTGSSVSDEFSIQGLDDFDYRSDDYTSDNDLLLELTADNFSNNQDYVFTYSRSYSYPEPNGPPLECVNTAFVDFSITDGVAIRPDSSTFIQWWPGNILAASPKNTELYNYEWGTDSGQEIIFNGDWFIAANESNFDESGYPVRDGSGERINYWVDISLKDAVDACPLRMYYTGDGFVPRSVLDENYDDLIIAPNPNSGQFKMFLPKDFEFIESIMIFDLLGRETTELDFSDQSPYLEVDLALLTSGVHFCRLSYHNGRIHTAKFIIE